ncbi:putative ribosome biogenesis GTPase RsgA [Microlunatus endophyticus]|uniref:Small ribosomal subunit biogenesis GTPase RsgA n=1 Tax=Microlunatus endophyticus TaxID=1716077 RepID=A0A917W2Z4_9ACTN|nr:ribosome small subunit-dependent GTPase A [Microlunatus endophyticus]GGL55932.1 putative ribosome biogenesis GTPase RsgA [Microlunatus endophyticus]
MTPRVVGEDDHARFERPQRRTRPRTKIRPDYSDAEVGMVITIDRGRYTCLVGESDPHEVIAAKARQLGRKGVIVGDRARLVGDTSGEEGTLARVVEVLDRATVLRRTADDDDPYERPIVANATQMVIVSALADPPPRTGMIDRCLVAGYDAGLRPLLCLTKSDLGSPDNLVALYEPLDVPIEITRPGADLSGLRARLAGQRSVFIGHSGVGKSTLVNALIPDAHRTTGEVNEVTGKGRHTSTAAYAMRLPALAEDPEADPGWVIDTPGVRSFGLSHVSRDRIVAAFEDLDRFVSDCPRGCTHGADAPDCGLDAAVARGDLSAARVASFRRMLSGEQ